MNASSIFYKLVITGGNDEENSIAMSYGHPYVELQVRNEDLYLWKYSWEY
jgi:hypothetical protein